MIKTFRYRVKDKHAEALSRMSRAVNVVWNFCNETQRTAIQRGDRWPSSFDLHALTTGCSKALGISSVVVTAACTQYRTALRRNHKRLLRFRGQRSLGWIPLRKFAGRHDSTSFNVLSTRWYVWMSRPLPAGHRVRDGSSFAQDSRGRWYLNIVCEVPEQVEARPVSSIGIDLGLKDLATLSTGEKTGMPRWLQDTAAKIGSAQRASKKRLARARFAKTANQRRDFLHKLSTRLVREHGTIFVGDVSSSWLAKTNSAKSVYNAGWSTLRSFLRYKAIAHGRTYAEVSERGSTQTCSDCGFVGGPKGREGLVVREWTCVGCGAVHDRDVNAARNILRWGRPAPTGAVA